MEDDKLLELSVSLLAGGRSPLETAEPARPQGSVRLRVGRLHLLLLHKVLAEMQVSAATPGLADGHSLLILILSRAVPATVCDCS